MAEDGIDISTHKSKVIDIEFFNSANFIITLCGDARDKCPVIPPQTKSFHWPLPDPVQVKATGDKQLIAFRNVRDEIKYRITQLSQLNL